MPLTLITGPANAGKAKLVLDEVRARVAEDPILVVPTFEDVDHYRRELAATEAVFGPSVMRFSWLVREIASRTGVPARTLSATQRERLVAEAVRRAGSGETPARGLVRAAASLIAELERERVTPQRLVQALRAWAAGGSGRDAHAERIGGIYSAYRRLLEELGLADGELLAWRALDALREAPASWGTTPVFFYGFDDLTRHELDAIEALAGIDGVEVTVALTWEARVALSGRATARQELLRIGADAVELPARADHYAPASRDALHHLERSLFEDQATRIAPGDAVRLLQSGGARAELELVGAEVLRLLQDGVAPADIAVVFRSPTASAALVRQVFGACGIPVTVDAPVQLGHTALGRGLLALLRCALTDASELDLLAYLRTPGLLRRPELADALETEIRQRGIRTASDARTLWEAGNWPLEAIDRIAAAHGRGPAALLDRARRELGLLFAGPYRGAARGLEPEELVDARVLSSAEEALAGLAELARMDATLAPDATALIEQLAALEVRPAGGAGTGAVQVLDPLKLRARRVRALFICGLQESEFPHPARPEPLLSDDQRDEIARASGLVLRPRGDAVAEERALFYLCASRPEELLALSYRTSDEEGNPSVRSFYVDDVRDLFTDELDARRRVRELSQVTWRPEQAPTPRERERALAATGPRHDEQAISSLSAPAVLEELAAREAWSAGQIEAYASCPVKWLVEKYLQPESFEPDSEPLARGSVAHAVLEATLTALRERTGSARLTPQSLPLARELLLAELGRREPELRLSTVPARARSGLRRLEADLLRYLRKSAERPSALEPAHLELSFGGRDDDHAAVALGDGLRLRGRIDRVDVAADGGAAVIDYKGSQGHPFAKWEQGRRLQVALYMLAVRELLGARPVAGIYQPLGGTQKARGIALNDSGLEDAVAKNDRVDEDELQATLERMRELAVEAAGALRDGRLEPHPERCHWRDGGGCSYPTICRCDSA